MLEILSQPTYLISAGVLFGLAVGSFLNVVIYRMPIMLENAFRRECAEAAGQTPADHPTFNLVTPRSACPSNMT